MKKHQILALIATCLALMSALSGCGSSPSSSTEPSKLNFSDDMEKLRKLDGEAVTLTGYMATLSPLGGEYIYLMNMPYQSCPFCVPNTTQLANTMAVYAKDGISFDYTDRPIKINGKLDIGDYTDDYGYQYSYRIVDASYEVVDLSNVSAEYALYQALSEDGVIADIYAMFDYLYFVSQWTECQSSYVDENGNEVRYYLYPGDAQGFLESDGPSGFAKQTSEDYFPELIRRVEAVSKDGLSQLVEVIRAAQDAEQYARAQFDQENYTYDEQTDKYTLNENDKIFQAYSSAYAQFDEWLANYEL